MPIAVARVRKPGIVIGANDHDRLVGLADTVAERSPEVAEALLAEMERARIVAPIAVPANVVRMESRVRFRSDDSGERCITLVYPGEADIAIGRVSVVTPVGAALIGLTEGQSIRWTGRDRRRHELTVLSVDQPDAAERL